MGEVVPTAPCGLQSADVYEKGMVETEEAVERDKTRAGCVASATGCVGGVVVDRVEGVSMDLLSSALMGLSLTGLSWVSEGDLGRHRLYVSVRVPLAQAPLR